MHKKSSHINNMHTNNSHKNHHTNIMKINIFVAINQKAQSKNIQSICVYPNYYKNFFHNYIKKFLTHQI